jgi:glycosyltransferase involved in cell wall biosynthesis
MGSRQAGTRRRDRVRSAAEPDFSIVIPYKDRLHNARVVLSAIADQTLPASRFEVVLGVLEYDPEFARMCAEFTDRVDIVSVLVDEEWNLSRARNLAIRQCRGRVLVFLDADMALPPGFLANLYDRHFAHGQNACVVGKMIGYDEVRLSDVDSAEALPYAHYRPRLAELDRTPGGGDDARWTPEFAGPVAMFPWAYVRGGLLSIPRATVLEHDLHFDEGFLGWGPEDQEWALRVTLTGTPILLGQDVYGLHLPHLRSDADNGATAWPNNRYYLGKWPRRELEVALAVGGWENAYRAVPEFERDLARCVGEESTLVVVRGTIEGCAAIAVGVVADRETHTPEAVDLFDPLGPLEVLPLAGLALPWEDKEIDECHVLAPALRLGDRYRGAILREADRVAYKVITEAE